jgi:SAM-dependent methyltransferase
VRLNLGCGHDIRDGWINIDRTPGPGVDHVVDFDARPHLPFADDSVEHSEASHLIEHLQRPLPFMEELWRVTAPGGTLRIRCPHGSSDDADEDPTHVRRMYEGSWAYFGQPHYAKADYGYRGDWKTDAVELILARGTDVNGDETYRAIKRQRNLVAEMHARLVAVKPPRNPRAEPAPAIIPVRMIRLPDAP